MKFADGFLLFEEMAINRGFTYTRSGEIVEVLNKGDWLRLKSIDAGVCLEITHGPVDGPPAGWLDLYADPNDPLLPTFVDCLEYGFDLMGGSRL
jgi:hypothetical protein